MTKGSEKKEEQSLVRKKKVEAVIFDFDDTLVDEEFWIKKRWEKTAIFAEEELGLKNFGRHFWKVFKQKGPRYKYHINETLNQLNQSQALLRPILNNFLSQISKERLYPGAVRCLDFLKERFKLGIITNGRKKTQLNRIKKAKIYHFFDVIICAYQRPKPSLRPYIECMARLRVSGNEAMYVSHDLKRDLEGAKRLGMTTVYLNPKGKVRPRGADLHIGSYSQLIKFFKD